MSNWDKSDWYETEEERISKDRPLYLRVLRRILLSFTHLLDIILASFKITIFSLFGWDVKSDLFPYSPIFLPASLVSGILVGSVTVFGEVYAPETAVVQYVLAAFYFLVFLMLGWLLLVESLKVETL